jgi:cold-inducible RNA-binding protein
MEDGMEPVRPAISPSPAILWTEGPPGPLEDGRMNLYVGNLPYTTTADDLRIAFAAYGSVTRAQIVIDRESNRSRGFGFVEMANGGDEAITALNGSDFHGRKLTVNEARPREARTRAGYSGRY